METKILRATARFACAMSCWILFNGCDDGAPPNPSIPGEGLPCAVADALTVCQTCHNDPTRFGSPMPLVDYADTQAASVTVRGERVWERMRARVHAPDPADQMPPPTSPTQLSSSQMAALDAWFAGGAPELAAGTFCGSQDGGGPDGGLDGPPVGPVDLPCTPRHSFLAHAPRSTEPFHVPEETANLYACFTFESPFQDGEQATAWAPIIDDERVIHHWILYRDDQGGEPVGSAGPCSGIGSGTFLMGWAPGGGSWIMPENVGLELPGAGETLHLEVHYWNVAGLADAADASGVAICTTDTPRDQTAGVLTLGSVDISIPPRAMGHQVVGNCSSFATSLLSSPISILGTGPHMHQLGTGFTTEILGGGRSGDVEMLDEITAWDFNAQTFYRQDPVVVINPRDALRTTCTYDNPSERTVSMGQRTEDEMCFNFMMIYPITALPSQMARYCVF